VAQGRLRDAKLRSGFGEASFARYRDKGEEVIEILALYS
jgi:hypothetical protein